MAIIVIYAYSKMTSEVLYKVGEDTIFPIFIFKYIYIYKYKVSTQDIKYISVSNVHFQDKKKTITI